MKGSGVSRDLHVARAMDFTEEPGCWLWVWGYCQGHSGVGGGERHYSILPVQPAHLLPSQHRVEQEMELGSL